MAGYLRYYEHNGMLIPEQQLEPPDCWEDEEEDEEEDNYDDEQQI